MGPNSNVVADRSRRNSKKEYVVTVKSLFDISKEDFSSFYEYTSHTHRCNSSKIDVP